MPGEHEPLQVAKAMKTVTFGIIGEGLMGRGLASAAARWCHLTDLDVRPQIIAVCDKNPVLLGWYQANFPALRQVTDDYRTCWPTPRSRPSTWPSPTTSTRKSTPRLSTRGNTSSARSPSASTGRPARRSWRGRNRTGPAGPLHGEFAFFPAVQRIAGMIESNAWGRIIELSTGLPSQQQGPRPGQTGQLEANGRVQRPLRRAGRSGHARLPVAAAHRLRPRNVRAILSKIVAERPDGKGSRAPLHHLGQRHLALRGRRPRRPAVLPLDLEDPADRAGPEEQLATGDPGHAGLRPLVQRQADVLEVLEYSGGEQVWGQVQMGYETPFPTVTGGIFQFGFSDAILQMWAAFLFELAHGRPLRRFVGCARPPTRPPGATASLRPRWSRTSIAAWSRCESAAAERDAKLLTLSDVVLPCGQAPGRCQKWPAGQGPIRPGPLPPEPGVDDSRDRYPPSTTESAAVDGAVAGPSGEKLAKAASTAAVLTNEPLVANGAVATGVEAITAGLMPLSAKLGPPGCCCSPPVTATRKPRPARHSPPPPSAALAAATASASSPHLVGIAGVAAMLATVRAIAVTRVAGDAGALVAAAAVTVVAALPATLAPAGLDCRTMLSCCWLAMETLTGSVEPIVPTAIASPETKGWPSTSSTSSARRHTPAPPPR